MSASLSRVKVMIQDMTYESLASTKWDLLPPGTNHTSQDLPVIEEPSLFSLSLDSCLWLISSFSLTGGGKFQPRLGICQRSPVKQWRKLILVKVTALRSPWPSRYLEL